MFNTLRTRLLFTFTLIAIIPLLLAGGLLSLRSFNAIQDERLNTQQQAARLAGSEILNFINERENQLRVISEVRHLTSANLEEQTATLASLLRYDSAYQEFALLDIQGQELVRISREREFNGDELANRSDQPEFAQPLATGAAYFSPIRFDEVLQEPTLSIAIPLEDVRTGAPSLILVAEFRFRALWDFIATLEDEDHSIYVTDSAGELVAHANPSLVLSRTRFPLPEKEGQATGLSGDEVSLAHVTLPVGDQNLIVFLERPLTDISAPANDNLRSAGLLLAGIVVVTLAVIAIAVRQFAQ